MSKLALLFLLLFFSVNSEAVCSKDCAIAKIIQQGWLKKAQQKQSNIFVYPKLLQVGTKIEVGPFKEQAAHKLYDKSWLFFADFHPGALYDHPTEFILVSQKTGQVHAIAKRGYPIVHGLHLFSSEDDERVKSFHPQGFPRFKRLQKISFPPLIRSSLVKSITPQPATPVNTGITNIDWSQFPTPADEVESEWRRKILGRYEQHQSDDVMNSEMNKCGCEEGTGKKIAVVIVGYSKESEKGYKESVVDYVYQNGYEAIVRIPHYKGVTQDRGSTTTRANVMAAFDEAVAKISGCCDEVLVVLSGHGSPGGSIDMNTTLRRPDPDNPGQTLTEGHPEGFYMSTSFMKEQLSKLKSCNVKVLISSCFAGKHLEKGLNDITAQDEGCMCRTVMTTSSARQVSYLNDTGEIFDFMKDVQGNIFDAFKKFKDEREAETQRWRNRNQTPFVQSTDCILCEDPDEDGVRTGIELQDKSDPGNSDSDNDGLTDGMEKEFGSLPNNSDSDGDKLTDAEEFELGTKPRNPDSDGDGVNDKHEIFGGTDPLDPDTDHDGINDGDEYAQGSSPTNPNDPSKK